MFSRIAKDNKPLESSVNDDWAMCDDREDSFYYPLKPEKTNDYRYLSCTLCGNLLEESGLTREAWEAHVDQDLQPYVCISEECREPPAYFIRKEDWLNHMQTRHSLTWTEKIHTEQWYCDIDHPSHLVFDEKDLFVNHLKADHGKQLTKSRLDGRARRNRRIVQREPFICPLCGCVPDGLEVCTQEQLSYHIAGHLKSLAYLSLSYMDDGRALLSLAVKKGHEAIVKLLLASDRLDPDTKDKNERTPLSWAAEEGHEAIVKLLLASGRVNPNVKDQYGWTPLWHAATKGYEAIVKLLLGTGKVDLEVKDVYGWTASLWAAANEREAILKLLLDAGVDVESKDPSGRTMLWWAVTRVPGGGHHDVIERLIAASADANASAAKFGGRTAIQASSESDLLDIVEKLVATNNASMATLSHMAVYEGVLGSLPLLGQFPSGFLEERSSSEGATIDPPFQIQAETYCRSLLKLGIIAMLQGEPGYACTSLKQAIKLSESRYPDVHIPAITHLIQCLHMQFKWSAAGSNISSVELDGIFDFITEIKHLQASLHSAIDYKHDLVRRLRALLELQRCLVTSRPRIPTSVEIDLARGIGTESVAQAIQNCRLSGVSEAEILPFEVELAYIYRVVGDRDRFHSVIDSVVPLKPTDFMLRAYHQLRLGDASAVTFGAPETWNMLLEQGTESNAQPRDDESTHFAMPLSEDLQAATSYYRNADVLYESVQHTCGQAAVQLRLGYLATLGIFSSSSATPTAYEVALAHVSHAKLLYGQAGDIAGVQVATAHSCLCRLGLAQFPDDSDAAKAIGQYGKEKGSYSLAFGLGLFFAKYARRWLVFLGDYEKALAAHKLAAAVFQGLGLKLSHAYSICDQLSVHELLGDQSMIYITAEEASNLCLEIERERPRTSPISQMALNHAVHVLGKIFQHANKRADPERLACIADILREWRRRGPSVSVKQLLSRQIELNQNIQSAMNEGKMVDVGELFTRLNGLNIDPVEFQTQGAYNLIDHFISLTAAMVPLYRSRQAVRNGDSNRAEDLWRETESALTAHPTSESEVLLASLSVSKRDFEAAAAHARAYKDQLVAAELHESIGTDRETKELLQRKKWQEKTRMLSLFVRVRLYEDAKSMVKELELEWGPDWWSLYEYPVWENLSIIAQVSGGLGEYERACDYYERAMEAFDKRRHALSADDHKIALAGDSVVQDIYFGAAHAAARWHLSTRQSGDEFLSPQVKRAFAAIERGKARSLLDLIEGAIPNHNADASVGSQWQQYKVEGIKLATLRSLLATCYQAQHLDRSTESRLKTKIQEKEKQLRELEGKLSAGGSVSLSAIGTVLSLPSLCKLLPEDTALLQYCYSRENMVVWKITASGMREVFVVDVPESCLESHILQYHKACATGSSGTRDHESWLATKLLPFKSLDESRLIIVTYRCLHQLPFHALPYQGQLLMSNKTISYLPSASVFGHLQSDPAPETDFSILAVGNPSNMSSKNSLTLEERPLPSLPSARVEVEAIGQLVEGTRALTGPNATKKAVSSLLGNYRVLHFATHGSLSAEVPMLSAIHLAEGENITVEDLMWRHLRADLVILSACKTGRGELTSGDDMIGFARALLAAGVKNVLVSLWRVDDAVTSFLMIKFYEHLKKEWFPARALQAAQLATRHATQQEVQKFLRRVRHIEPELELGEAAHADNYSHPMYWAPFIVIGSCYKVIVGSLDALCPDDAESAV
ncbi:hypothetical protein FOWG_16689 [Fusarium oxysporum f. sp. lycopersici MN25]|nr:hypothetical protein FOWG_16689 [Fusarium oxysporum f. sp. lycopersici MN25]